MSSAKAIGPISLAFLALGVVGVLGASVMMPAAELVPAQVDPAVRESGESPVRLPEAMAGFAKLGMQIIDSLPKPGIDSDDAAAKSSADVVKDWEDKIIKSNGEVYGKTVVQDIENRLGGRENVQKVVTLVKQDRNFFYGAYSLFLGLALFAGAVAIQAIGRHAAEEKTIVPLKK